MLIHAHMSLDYLKERMSNTDTVSDKDAAAMREMLVEEFDGEDTTNVPENNWNTMLARL